MASNKKKTFKELLEELKKTGNVPTRNIEEIPEKKYFLIVSEGIKTEPIYFKYIQQNILPKNLLETVVIHGEGDNTINVVHKAIELKKEREKKPILPNFDEVWAVFDKDDFPDDRFNAAIQIADQNNIKCGYSNEAFELWYVLHFQLLEAALKRHMYFDILTAKLGFKYEKNTIAVVQKLFSECNIRRAIGWARRLEENHIGAQPAYACPVTKVHILVENLLEYAKHDY